MKLANWIPILVAAGTAPLVACSSTAPVEGPHDPVTIVAFSADRAFLQAGDSTRLSWVTRDAYAVRITDDAGNELPLDEQPVHAGTRVLSPARTTLYTIAATGASGAQVLRELKVELDPSAPKIDFRAAEKRIELGGSTRLSWTVANATHVALRSGGATIVRNAKTSSSHEVQPERTAIYSIEAQGPGGSVASKQVRVEVAPVILSFQASPAPPIPPKTEVVTLSWTTSGADSLVLSDAKEFKLEIPAEEIASGSASVPASSPGPWRLTAMRDEVVSEKKLTLDILEAPSIEQFEIQPNPVTASRDAPAIVTASWKVKGADTIELRGNSAVLVLEGLEGTVELEVTETTSFVLVAQNEAGTTTREAKVATLAPLVIDVFETSAPTVNAGETVTLSWSTSGGMVSLTPALEVTTTETFTDISSTGTPLVLGACGTSVPLDEGCAIFPFPDGFAFPFDGSDRAGIRIYVNGFAGFDLGPEPGETATPHPLPSSLHTFVHLAPFWSDLSLDPAVSTDASILSELRTLPDGRALFVQWNRAFDPGLRDIFSVDSSFDFQLVLWESGAFEYRYGSMSAGANHQPRADGEGVTIGHQNSDGTIGSTINGGVAVAGGLGDRSWHVAAQAPAAGSRIVTVRETTTFELCVTRADSVKTCVQRTVTVD